MTTAKPLLLVAALLAAALPMLPAAAADEPAPPLPPGCEEALTRTRETLLAQQGTIGFPDAVALLQAEAGGVCGFDVYAGVAGSIDPRAVAQYVVAVGPAIEMVPPDGPGVPGRLTELLDARVSDCGLPGTGGGTVRGYVLGVPVKSEVAQGQWEPIAANKVEVNGEGALLGGTQAGDTGVIRIASVAPLPALKGDTATVCIEVEQVTTLRKHCFLTLWPIGWACETGTTAAGTFALCGATAKQRSVLDLVVVDHAYEFEAAPAACDEL